MNEHRSDLVLLDDIIESIDHALLYSKGMTMNDFMGNRLVQDGVIRNFMVMGEAVKRLSAQLREAHPDVPWKRIAGMHDKLVHDYMGIDRIAVWLTVERILPGTRSRLAEIRNTIS